jgi:hypothetical protein
MAIFFVRIQLSNIDETDSKIYDILHKTMEHKTINFKRKIVFDEKKHKLPDACYCKSSDDSLDKISTLVNEATKFAINLYKKNSKISKIIGYTVLLLETTSEDIRILTSDI